MRWNGQQGIFCTGQENGKRDSTVRISMPDPRLMQLGKQLNGSIWHQTLIGFSNRLIGNINRSSCDGLGWPRTNHGSDILCRQILYRNTEESFQHLWPINQSPIFLTLMIFSSILMKMTRSTVRRLSTIVKPDSGWLSKPCSVRPMKINLG
jgi:hypothetical protein